MCASRKCVWLSCGSLSCRDPERSCRLRLQEAASGTAKTRAELQELQSAVYRLYGSTAALQGGADGPSSTQGLGEEEKGGALLDELLLDETSALAHVALDGAGVGFLVAVEGRVRELERLVRSSHSSSRRFACATIG